MIKEPYTDETSATQTSVRDEPKQCTKAAKDFLLVVLHAYVVAAGKVCCDESEIADNLVIYRLHVIHECMMTSFLLL